MPPRPMGLLAHVSAPDAPATLKALTSSQRRALEILHRAAERVRITGSAPSRTVLDRLDRFATGPDTRRRPSEHGVAMRELAAAAEEGLPLSNFNAVDPEKVTAFHIAAHRLREQGVQRYPAKVIYGIWNSAWGIRTVKQHRAAIRKWKTTKKRKAKKPARRG